jgi:hypothetical protein
MENTHSLASSLICEDIFIKISMGNTPSLALALNCEDILLTLLWEILIV